ncbi:uncharacterized protein LOC133744337 [Rosa rugosa]|uniref:uncharacterized protein LOC133744337 n=1 Tax=Rosa rugosa TaxID=74645 RepID=UPI002B400EF4|nr:uncharacterized protein LOC133744337 [Rosa rugosa]
MASSSKRSVNWSPLEDEALTVAFVKVSQNSVNGTSQSEDGLWIQVQQKFMEIQNTILVQRTWESCKSRWQKHIFPQMNKWHSCIKRAERTNQSGGNLEDQKRQAEEYFRDDNRGKNFNFLNCYKLAKECNWATFEDTPQVIYNTPTSQQNSSFELDDDVEPIITSSTHSPPTTSPIENPRPIGRNAARRRLAKRKEAESNVGEEMVAHLNQLREDLQKSKEERARRDQLKEERRERDREEAILAMQTINFTPLSKEYYDGKKREIMEKIRRRELFPSSGSTSNEYRPEMPFNDSDE